MCIYQTVIEGQLTASAEFMGFVSGPRDKYTLKLKAAAIVLTSLQEHKRPAPPKYTEHTDTHTHGRRPSMIHWPEVLHGNFAKLKSRALLLVSSSLPPQTRPKRNQMLPASISDITQTKHALLIHTPNIPPDRVRAAEKTTTFYKIQICAQREFLSCALFFFDPTVEPSGA